MPEKKAVKKISSNSTYIAISNSYAAAKNQKLLSRDAQKLEAWLISQIRPRDKAFMPYRISAEQITDLFEVTKNYSYQKLNNVSNELLTHIIHIKEDNIYKKYGLISSSAYHSGEGWCEMSIHPDLEPHLLNLKSGGKFAVLELFVSWSFKCIYSYPLYKYLKSFLHNGQDYYVIEVKIDFLKQIIGCHKKYPNYSNFNARVLNAVKNEFKEKADILFTYTPSVKVRKKVIAVNIEISRKEKLPTNLQDLSDIPGFKNTDLDRKNIISNTPLDNSDKSRRVAKYSDIAKELIRLGFIGDAEGYIENEGRELVEEALEAFNAENLRNVKNKVGLLREKIRALKIKKEIEKIDIEEERTYGENIFLGKLERYKILKTNFSEDYKRFINIPTNSNSIDQEILQKHVGIPLNEIPLPILKEFIKWRVG
jgi:plasmid replication initiation protein